MLTAIEAGYISAVFVKNLSRLGRNYIEVGKLTEEFFPLHDIRLVAVSDGVDSEEGEDDFTPFKNIMNKYYAKDISKKRRIYRMALEGYGLAETAARLAADGVVNPTYYNPEENRAIFLNVHEAIIDRQTWEKVQALQKGTRRKKPTVTQEPSVFSGLLKCPECGGNLNFHFNQNNHDIKFFSCQNHNSGNRKCSKTHYIRLDFWEQVVLHEVKRLACFASEYENDFMIERPAKVAENTTLRKQRELDMLFERRYEDNVSGKIDDVRFAKMSKRYEQEQSENAKKIKALRLELKKDESKRMDIGDFLETVRR